ncbi:sugar ABC transporter substrate-binding protein [Agathobaculum sp. NTUH-O15-33]|uniref:sugar ABC transporter substrate-binding protein n=1 Tax=Agathobaculum sp. NTUH-O15-33 TaxID=3079302 RepID=UPI0029588F26|nr:sugar ABC transporter substrate-binding protein [Agathobaculum sp. NTUH-O15-33]WNX85918.1 sugar ABC transporter substrate-binding protein [Agathobaculum sp. NTUH-O15-33]
MAKANKWIAAALAGAMLTGLLAGCGAPAETEGQGSGAGADADGAPTDGGTFTVAYCNANDADTFCAIRKDALIEKVDASGKPFELQCADAMGDSTKQLGDADTFIAAGVDVLIINPIDSDAVVPAVQSANAAGIPVVLAGVKATAGDYIYVGSRDYEAGHMQGEFMAKSLPQNAKVLYLAGTSGAQHSVERHDGFLDALEEAGRGDVEILAELDGNYEMAKGMQFTEDWIQKYDRFDAIVAANDSMALGAVEALKGANRLAGVQVTGIDGLKEAYAAIQAGEMVQTILQNAPGQAEAAYDVAMRLKNGENVDSEVLVPFESVTADNVDQYAS